MTLDQLQRKLQFARSWKFERKLLRMSLWAGVLKLQNSSLFFAIICRFRKFLNRNGAFIIKSKYKLMKWYPPQPAKTIFNEIPDQQQQSCFPKTIGPMDYRNMIS